MAIQHNQLPIYGVQFHPESILSEYGDFIIKNWLNA
jgi:para-aminobenzoate synthetase component 2